MKPKTTPQIKKDLGSMYGFFRWKLNHEIQADGKEIDELTVSELLPYIRRADFKIGSNGVGKVKYAQIYALLNDGQLPPAPYIRKTRAFHLFGRKVQITVTVRKTDN